MHELSVVFTILDQVEAAAKANNVARVNSVTLEIGEVSTVVPMYLADVWKWAVEKREVTKGCKLKWETIEAITYCQDCHKTYSTIKFAKKCPFCQSERTYLLQGNELVIKEITTTDDNYNNEQKDASE